MSINNLPLLRYFYAVATEGNFTKAAKKLYIGQPVVSQMVKNLEDRMGVQLFERQKRQVLLTHEGAELLKSCQVIFQEMESLQKRLTSTKDTIRGKVKMGSTEVIAMSLLPEIHADFLREFPQSNIHALSGPAHVLAELVSKNQIDFAITGYIQQFPDQIEAMEIATVSHHIVVHRDVYEKRQKLKELTFISSRSAESEHVDAQPVYEKLKAAFPGITTRISTNNLYTHKTLVMKKAGVAVLPHYLIEKELMAGTLKDLFPKDNLEFSISLLKRKSFTPGPLEEWYIQNFKNLFVST